MRKENLMGCIGGALILFIGAIPSTAATVLTPGIYSPDDLTAAPESVSLVSVGTDNYDEAAFRKESQETFNLEVYELSPGLYRFVTDPAAKTDPAALNSDINTLNISNLVADSGAEGVLIRGTGKYPGETAISFGLLKDYPALPTMTDGSFDYNKAAGEIGYQLYTGRRCFNVDGVIAVFENVSIGDHANNNIGAVHVEGGGRTFMKDVWIYNVYDGVFFDDAGDAYFDNCIFHQTYVPWNTLEDANAAGYFTEDWIAIVQPDGLDGTPYADGVGLSVDEYPQLAGVILGNQTASAWNINLFETEGANPQNLYFKNCTIVKHQIRDSNRLWRHNTGGGEGAFVLMEDCMILSVDLSPNDQIRLDTDDPDFFGSMYNTKIWNYASGNSNLNGVTVANWNIDPTDPAVLEEFKVDLSTPGGLDVSDVSQLFRLDGRLLTTFAAGAVELTLASDGGPIGYRLPKTAPAGSLPVTTGETIPGVNDWSLF